MQIWHADVHYLIRNKLFLYAIEDDRSHFIVVFRVIIEKPADVCAEVLEEAIQNFGKPAIMWTDNGGENTGNKMLKLLKH